MSGNKIRPSRWYYLLAFLLPVFACGLTGFLVFRNVPKLPGALDAFDVKQLTPVIVPGSAEINFPRSGAYSIYYEYRSDIYGVRYVRAQNLPRIICQLTSKASGEEIELESTFVEGEIYTTQNKERAGVLMNNISINQPGVHEFSCRYQDGRSNPQIVLAIGPNMIWEFFNLAVKPVAAIAAGLIVFFFMSVISLCIVIFVAIKRNQSKNRLAS
ncbi:MAG: hypothetical protein ACK2UE_19490 [Anaerolineales bacterium]